MIITVNILIFNFTLPMPTDLSSFSALTLLVEHQEGHPAC